MNHTPVKVVAVTAGAVTATTISDKHRAIIISNTGSGVSTVTLVFMDKNGQNTGNFEIKLAANSGPFYIPCRITSVSCATSNASIALLV
jgi:hypothetical protein